MKSCLFQLFLPPRIRSGILSTIFATLVASRLEAAVVSGAVGITDGMFGDPQTVSIWPGLIQGYYCGSSFLVVSYADAGFDIVGGSIADAYNWFQVTEGAAIDRALVLGGPFLFPANSINAVPLQQPGPGETLLLGYWVERGFFYDPGPGDCFGWVRFHISANGIEIIDDAVENSGAGIYAGTRIVVPEPSNMLAWTAMWILTKRRFRLLHTC